MSAMCGMGVLWPCCADGAPAACKSLVNATSDILCYQRMEVFPYESLTWSWYEVSRSSSTSDNAGTVTFDVYGEIESATTSLRCVLRHCSAPIPCVSSIADGTATVSSPCVVGYADALCASLVFPFCAVCGGVCERALVFRLSTPPRAPCSTASSTAVRGRVAHCGSAPHLTWS